MTDRWESERRFRETQRKMSESQRRRHALKRILAPLHQMEAAA